MNVKVIVYKNHIHFTSYPFAVASVTHNPDVYADDILEIHSSSAPPEIVTKKQEILFISAQFRDEVKLFAQYNRIRDIARTDVWSLVNEPFLDTEFSPEEQWKTLEELAAAGFDRQEVEQIRATIKDKMQGYNAFHWEWVHLGHMDVLAAHDNALHKGITQSLHTIKDKEKLGTLHCIDSFSNHMPLESKFYDWCNRIALRTPEIGYPSINKTEMIKRAIEDVAAKLASHAKKDTTTISRRLYKTIADAYNGTARHYHNIEHAYHVSQLCWNHSTELSERKRIALQLAAWFHDSVYFPDRNDNEEESAKFLETILSDSIVDKEMLHNAKELILFTRHNRLAVTDCEKIISDADLAIFAENSEVYKQYTAAIRKEYHFLDDATFYKGRKQFVETLLVIMKERGGLFYISHPIHEELAKENITRELSDYNTC